MAKLNLGRVGIVPQGDFDNTKTYSKMDMVYYPTTGSSYVSLADNNTALPTDSTKWQSAADVSNEVAAANAAAARANTAAEAAEAVSDEVAELKSQLGVDYVDNKVTSSELTQGNIADLTGGTSSSNTRVRTSNTIDLNTEKISVESGYKFSLYAYNGSTYLGGWTGTQLHAGYDIAWLTEPFMMSNLSSYTITKIIIVLAYTSNAAITPADADKKLILSYTTNYAVQALNLAKSVDDKADSIDDKVFGMTDEQSATFNASTTGNNTFDIVLYNGRTYKFTNTSGGSVNLKLIKADGTLITIFSSVVNNGTEYFKCEITDCVGISVYYNTAGSVSIESADAGLFDSVSNLQGLPVSKYTTVSMFETLGAIGDSYTSGGIYGVTGVEDGAYYDVSWPQILARHCGLIATNYSKSGYDISRWLTDTSIGLQKLEEDAAKNLYVTFMGINAEKSLSDVTVNVPVGTTSDINMSNPEQNADTFCGHYGRMLSGIISHAPHAKIILVKPQSNDTEKRAAIDDIATLFGLPVIDMKDDEFYRTSFYNDNKHTGHPIAATYAGMALAFERQINKCIVDNITYFTDYTGD